jgi:hypothetical protein
MQTRAARSSSGSWRAPISSPRTGIVAFLAYVVEESLAGRADRIKAYSIATTVFGRDASFDPQSDPIVRVEAGHLRRALERYYLGAGREDPVEITIPRGVTVPPSPGERRRRRSGRRPSRSSFLRLPGGRR